MNSTDQYLRSLFKKLIINREKYFDGDYVNSDGRKILEDIFKLIIEEKPGYRRRIYRVRRDPSIQNILKFGEDIIGVEVYEWFHTWFL